MWRSSGPPFRRDDCPCHAGMTGSSTSGTGAHGIDPSFRVAWVADGPQVGVSNRFVLTRRPSAQGHLSMVADRLGLHAASLAGLMCATSTDILVSLLWAYTVPRAQQTGRDTHGKPWEKSLGGAPAQFAQRLTCPALSGCVQRPHRMQLPANLLAGVRRLDRGATLVAPRPAIRGAAPSSCVARRRSRRGARGLSPPALPALPARSLCVVHRRWLARRLSSWQPRPCRRPCPLLPHCGRCWASAPSRFLPGRECTLSIDVVCCGHGAWLCRAPPAPKPQRARPPPPRPGPGAGCLGAPAARSPRRWTPLAPTSCTHRRSQPGPCRTDALGWWARRSGERLGLRAFHRDGRPGRSEGRDPNTLVSLPHGPDALRRGGKRTRYSRRAAKRAATAIRLARRSIRSVRRISRRLTRLSRPRFVRAWSAQASRAEYRFHREDVR